MNEALPIAGAGAVGLLALAGAGLALRRRRRRREEIEAEEQWAAAEAERSTAAEPAAASEPARAPAFAAPTAAATAAPMDEKAPVTALPAGFDLSRFGPHVQAAYRGPTPDNPSLSLRYRLRRAGALDQRERLAAEAKAEAAPESRAPAEGGFMIGRDRSKTEVRPAYTH